MKKEPTKKKYWDTHSWYFHIGFFGKLENKDKAHIIRANGFKGRLGALFGRCWLYPYPTVGISSGRFLEIHFLNFWISFGIADWKK